MKRLGFVAFLVVLMVFAGVNRPVQGYGSAGHVYIAQRALFTVSSNALYGSMAPDIPTVDIVTHHSFNLVVKAVTLPERMFALGWMTHNEEWGADSFAHVLNGGYAWVKGQQILHYAGASMASLPNRELLAHLAAEIAVDIMLQQRDQLLAMKVYSAAQLRSASIPNFLWQSGAIPEQELALGGEAAFRDFTKQYAMALAFSSPSNLDVMSEFVAGVANEQYGAPVNRATAKAILRLSIQLCQPDYLPVVNAAIRQVQFRVWSGQF